MSTASSQGDSESPLVDYKILSTLGKGKFATVKAAVHLPTGKQCAMKFIDKPPQGTKDFAKARRAYLNETTLLTASRDHPNILHLLAHFETPGKYVLVTEHLGGGELWDRISKSLFRPFEEHDAAVHALVLASALAHLHDPSRYIVHRDLKTPNLVYRAKPTIGRDKYDRKWDPRGLVVVDFGIARRWWLKGIEDEPEMTPDEIEREQEREAAGPEGLFGKDDADEEGSGIMMRRFCGSPLWMAPEIVRGQGYGREVDMWAFGVICYGILTGLATPLPGLSAVGQDYSPLLKPPKGGIEYPVPPLTPLAVDFLKGLLCWNPKERMTAGMCLQHKWLTDLVGGDWIRWEGMVRTYAAEQAEKRRAANKTSLDGAEAGYDPSDWKVVEWIDIAR
jgi:serine/threonine protein kinase